MEHAGGFKVLTPVTSMAESAGHAVAGMRMVVLLLHARNRLHCAVAQVLNTYSFMMLEFAIGSPSS